MPVRLRQLADCRLPPPWRENERSKLALFAAAAPAPVADALSVASAASKQRLAGGGCGGCDCLSAANEVGSVNDSRASERAEDERRSAFCLQTTDKRTQREFCTRRRLERTNVVINAPLSDVYRRHRALQTYRTY